MAKNRFLTGPGLKRFYIRLKEIFAFKKHEHTIDEITDFPKDDRTTSLDNYYTKDEVDKMFEEIKNTINKNGG